MGLATEDLLENKNLGLDYYEIKDLEVKKKYKEGASRMLRRVATAHTFYAKANEYDRGRILDSLEPIFNRLEKDFRISKSFCVLYVLYGELFFKYERTINFKNMEEFITAL